MEGFYLFVKILGLRKGRKEGRKIMSIFYFICPAKFLIFLDNSRIYFICTAKFLAFSDDRGIW
jgi:hypothetical protein